MQVDLNDKPSAQMPPRMCGLHAPFLSRPGRPRVPGRVSAAGEHERPSACVAPWHEIVSRRDWFTRAVRRPDRPSVSTFCRRAGLMSSGSWEPAVGLLLRGRTRDSPEAIRAVWGAGSPCPPERSRGPWRRAARRREAVYQRCDVVSLLPPAGCLVLLVLWKRPGSVSQMCLTGVGRGPARDTRRTDGGSLWPRGDGRVTGAVKGRAG